MILYNPDDTENTYYEQYNTCAGSVKTGDFVYVATDGGRQQIAQIDAIWSMKEYVTYYIYYKLHMTLTFIVNN